VKVFAVHYSKVEHLFKAIDCQLAHLEAKIAECFGRFNKIEWRLHRRIHELNQSSLLNEELLKLNAEIE
jgi:hypothetical protein